MQPLSSEQLHALPNSIDLMTARSRSAHRPHEGLRARPDRPVSLPDHPRGRRLRRADGEPPRGTRCHNDRPQRRLASSAGDRLGPVKTVD
jgi:hypothetical protein